MVIKPERFLRIRPDGLKESVPVKETTVMGTKMTCGVFNNKVV